MGPGVTQGGYGNQPMEPGVTGQGGYGNQPMGPGVTGQGGYGNQPMGPGMPQSGGFGQPDNMGHRTGFPDMNQNNTMGFYPNTENGGIGNTQNGSNQPKKSHTGLIVGIIAGVIVLLGIIGGILFVRGGSSKNGYNSPEEVVRVFFESYTALDKEKMTTCFPSRASNVEATVNANMATAESKKDVLTLYTDKMTFETKTMTDSELSEFKKSTNMSSIKEGYVVYTEIPFIQDVNGTTVNALDCYDINVAKVGKKYYLINMKEVDVKILDDGSGSGSNGDVTTEQGNVDITTEAVTDTNTEATTVADNTTEAPAAPSGSSKLGDASGLSDDPLSLQIKIDGKVYAIPFNFNELLSDWTFDSSYYDEEEDRILEPGDDSLCIYELKNSKYEDFYFDVGFTNHTDETKTTWECDVTKLYLDISYTEGAYPEVVLPKGITWGSTVADVVAAYGEPEDEPYYSDSFHYYSYEYTNDDYSVYVTLSIYEDGGLKEIDIRSYE